MQNKILTKRLKEFKKFNKQFVTHKKDSIKSIHNLRIHCRELSSLLSPENPFYTQVKKLIKASNAIRDMDVFLTVYLPSLPKDYKKQLDIKSIKKSILKKRKKKVAQLHAYMHSLAPSKSLDIAKKVNKTSDKRDLSPLVLEKKELHKYRIRIKKQLYKEKNSRPRNKDKIKTLTEIKDLLGTINDNYNGLKTLRRYNLKANLYNQIQDFTQEQNEKIFLAVQKITTL